MPMSDYQLVENELVGLNVDQRVGLDTYKPHTFYEGANIRTKMNEHSIY